MNFSLVVPTYNEKENITPLLDALRETLESTGDYEIIVVDDDSPDLTWMAVEDYSRKDGRVRLIRRLKDRGLSKAVIEGFGRATGSVLGVIDADLSHDHRILPQMIAAVREDGYDLAVGSRRVTGGGADKWPWYRKISSDMATFLAKSILDVQLSDPMSGYFALRREIFERARGVVDPKGYKILLEIFVRSRPQRVVEIPFVFKDRKQGHSKMTLRVILEYLAMLLRLRFGG